MATFTVANGGGNINAAATYTANSGIPGAADTIVFTTTSGQLTVNATTTVLDIDFSNYKNVITFNAPLSISRNITFADAGGNATYTVAGTSELRKTGTGNLTSNGKTWTGNFTFAPTGSSTVTLLDLCTFSGTVLFSTTATVTLSSNNVLDPERFNVTGDFQMASTGVLSGTALIKFTGTANQSVSWTNSSVLRTNVKIDKTGGTLTFSGTLNYNTGTFTYVQGNTDTGTSTLAIGTASVTLNTNGSSASGATVSSSTGINWYNITAGSTITLTSNLTTINNFASSAGAVILSGTTQKVYLGGGLTASNGITSSSVELIFNGTGTWSGSSAVAAPLTINTTGTLTISGSVTFSTRTLTYTTAASVVTTGSTLSISTSCTLATNGMTWNNISTATTSTITLSNNLSWNGTFSMTTGNITFAGVGPMSGAALTITTGGTVTLNSDVTCTGLVTLGSGGVATTLSSSGGTRTIITSGGITNGTTSGSVVCNINIKVTGGTITSSGNVSTGGYYQVNTTYQFEIDGNVTFASTGAFYIYGGVNTGTGGTFKYTSGTVTTTGSSIYIHSLYVNLGSVTWDNVWILSGAATISVLQSDLIVNGLLTLGYLTVAFTINNDGTTRTINANGGIAMSGSTSIVSGTANIKATAGTITGISSVQLRNNLELAGNITFASGVTFNYNTGILLYTSGTITTTNSTLAIATTTTLNTNGVTWFNIASTGAATLTLSSDFTWTGTFSATTGTVTFAGAGSLISSSGSLSLSGSCAMTIKNALSLTTLTVTSNGTTTLTGDLTCTGLVSLGVSSVATTLSSSGGTRTIITSGGITNGTTTGYVVCNINIKVTGGTITSGGSLSGGYYQINTTYQFEIDGNVTFASASTTYIYGGVTTGTGGTFKYTSGTVTTTGSSVWIQALKFNPGNIEWNNVWFISGTASTTVLQSNVTVNGLLTLGYTTVAFTINNDGTTRTITAAGGITLSGTTSIISGTANINCTGGTITGLSNVQLRLNLTLNGNITFASGVTFSYNTGTLTYTSGTITTTNSTLSSVASTTFATDGMSWNNVTLSGNTTTFTFTNDFTLTGTLTLSGTSGTNMALQSSSIYTSSILVNTTATTFGTATINFTGTGTWNHSAAGYLVNNVNINTSGTLTLGANIYYGINTITYIAGTVDSTTNSSTINLLISTPNTWYTIGLNTGGMSWYNVILTSVSSGANTLTVTVSSDLNVLNNLTIYNNNSTTTFAGTGILSCTNLIVQGASGNISIFNFNGNNIYTKNLTTSSVAASTNSSLNNANLYISGDITIGSATLLAPLLGTAEIYYVGSGTWRALQNNVGQVLAVNFTLNTGGTLTLSGNVYYSTKTFTHRRGKISAKNSTFNITAAATFVDCNNLNFDRVVITSGITVTMTEFFSGSPTLKTTVSPSSTTNYTITFSDATEKLARHLSVSRATISRANQLTVVTEKGNGGNNVGIKFAPNQISNGLAKNKSYPIYEQAYGERGLLKDPCLN